MKNLRIMVIGAGLLAMSAVETLAKELPTAEVVTVEANELEFSKAFDLAILDYSTGISLDKIDLGELSDGYLLTAPDGVYVAPVAFKVPVYSVSLPDENKIVLVRDPKGFHEQALKHKMEYIAIKPTLKSEYWEFVPVFSVQKSLSFDPKTTTEHASEEEMEMLRIVPVADFIRYN